MTRNALVDHYRRQATRPIPAAPGDLPDHVVDEEATGSERDELGQCVRSLMHRLPRDYREAIRLTDLEGRTQQQAGQVLGLTASGAKSRVQRGRRMLRDQVARCCVIALDSSGAAAEMTPRGSSSGC